MIDDDLRTRAREAAAEEWVHPREHVGYDTPPPEGCRCDECYVTERQRIAFEDGYLAHAAQQPSLPHRDELAAVILDATVPFRGPGGQTVPYVQPVHYAMADAVLALLTGDESDE